MLRKIRLTLAVIFYSLITLLLLDFTGTLHHWLGWMANIQFLPAVLALNFIVVTALVAITLIFGRVYCSVICPLGVMQDIISWIHGRKARNRFTYSPSKRWLRYGVLVVFAVTLALGVSAVWTLIAPYGSYGRIVNNLLQPVWLWANNALAFMAERAESYAFYSKEVWIKSGVSLAIAVSTFVVLAVLAWRGGRTYCNTICPVGTTLGFLSRFSLLKVRFDAEKCRDCGLCSKNCKASCIDVKNRTVDYSRCVTCGNCLDKCKFDSLHYGLAKSAPSSVEDENKADTAEEQPEKETVGATDTARRAFIATAAAATAGAALAQANKKVDGGLAEIEDKKRPARQTHVTPPGSLSIANMAQRCVACHLCVAQCPNDVLRPSNDPTRLMQPEMNFDRGFCRPECHRCSDICPSGAIQPIKPEEKAAIQIGHAVWIKKNCVVLTDGVECGNCARHCPAGAIMMVLSDPNDENAPMVPAVDASRCIGCGSCEYVCPARPFSAIYVEGHEVHKRI